MEGSSQNYPPHPPMYCYPPALEETGLTAALFDRPDSGCENMGATTHASQKRFEIAVKTIPERLEKENVRT